MRFPVEYDVGFNEKLKHRAWWNMSPKSGHVPNVLVADPTAPCSTAPDNPMMWRLGVCSGFSPLPLILQPPCRGRSIASLCDGSLGQHLSLNRS